MSSVIKNSTFGRAFVAVAAVIVVVVIVGSGGGCDSEPSPVAVATMADHATAAKVTTFIVVNAQVGTPKLAMQLSE